MKILMAVLFLLLGFSGVATASVQTEQQSLSPKIMLAEGEGDGSEPAAQAPVPDQDYDDGTGNRSTYKYGVSTKPNE